jgi:hypothetical protein
MRVKCYLPESQNAKIRYFQKYVLLDLVKLRNADEELNDLYPSPIIVRVIKSRRMKWVGHVARMGEEKGVYRVLVGKPEGKRPPGRNRCRWEDSIKMDLQEVCFEGMDWIDLAQDSGR